MSELRRVRRLSVRAREASDGRRVAIRLEDALKTASIGGARRLLVIRQFDLGPVPPAISSQGLSLLVEKRLRELERYALRFDAPGVETASAVWFPDRLTALVAFVEASTRPGGLSAWFWARVVPGGASSSSPRFRSILILKEALKSETGAFAVARLMGRLAARRLEGPLLESISPEDGASLLSRLLERTTPLVHSEPATRQSLEVPILPARFSELLEEWVRRWGASDPRSVWLAVIALWQARPGSSSYPATYELANAVIARFATESTPRGRVFSEKQRRLFERVASSSEPRAAEAADSAGPDGTRREPFAPEHAARADDVTEAVATVDPGFSAFGGLYFIVAVLSRLGFDDFLAAHPRAWELELGREVLLAVAARVGVTVDDPVLTPLLLDAEVSSALEGEAAAAFVPFDLGDTIRAGLAEVPLCEGSRLGDESARVLADSTDFVLALGRPGLPEPGATCVGPLGRESDFATLREAWLTAIERWLARYTELDLMELVTRRARVVVTSTHVDLSFTHRDADVRTRLAALDLDPGWVHWLGRVVTYHYVEELES